MQRTTEMTTADTLHVTTTAFEPGHLCRLVAWHAMDKPPFMDPGNAAESAQAFLERVEQGRHQDLFAVSYVKDEASRREGRLFDGPLAVLRVSFGNRAQIAYVDPSFQEGRAHRALMHQLDRLIDATPALQQRLRLAA